MVDMNHPARKLIEQSIGLLYREIEKKFPDLSRADLDAIVMPQEVAQKSEGRLKRVKDSRGRPAVNQRVLSLVVGTLVSAYLVGGILNLPKFIANGQKFPLKDAFKWASEIGLDYVIPVNADPKPKRLENASTIKRYYYGFKMVRSALRKGGTWEFSAEDLVALCFLHIYLGVPFKLASFLAEVHKVGHVWDAYFDISHHDCLHSQGSFLELQRSNPLLKEFMDPPIYWQLGKLKPDDRLRLQLGLAVLGQLVWNDIVPLKEYTLKKIRLPDWCLSDSEQVKALHKRVGELYADAKRPSQIDYLSEVEQMMEVPLMFNHKDF